MKIKINVPDGISNDWKVETFIVSEEKAKYENMRAIFGFSARSIEPGTYKRLVWRSQTVMSNTPAEIRDHYELFEKAKELGGSVLINGLGLGVALKHLLTYNNITDITVIENSEYVIELVAPSYKNKKVDIINADAFEYQPPKGKKYSVVWHDIWNFICPDNLPEMHRLHRKYGRRAVWQGSWCREECEYYKGRDW